MTFFANNMWKLPLAVNRGDLDYHLVRPVSTLFFVSLRDFAANSFVNLLMAVGVLVWAVSVHPTPLPAWRIALFAAVLPFADPRPLLHAVALPAAGLLAPRGLGAARPLLVARRLHGPSRRGSSRAGRVVC